MAKRGIYRRRDQMTEDKDWTVGVDGRSNTSRAFNAYVRVVERILKDHRLEDRPLRTARLIIARLAHGEGLAPTRPFRRQK